MQWAQADLEEEQPVLPERKMCRGRKNMHSLNFYKIWFSLPKWNDTNWIL